MKLALSNRFTSKYYLLEFRGRTFDRSVLSKRFPLRNIKAKANKL